MYPEDRAYIMFKQAQQMPWQYSLAKRLAQMRRMAKATAAGVNLMTTPWGQAQVIRDPGPTKDYLEG